MKLTFFRTPFSLRSGSDQLRPKMINAIGEPKVFYSPICSRRTALLLKIPSGKVSIIPCVTPCPKDFSLSGLPAEMKSENPAKMHKRVRSLKYVFRLMGRDPEGPIFLRAYIQLNPH